MHTIINSTNISQYQTRLYNKPKVVVNNSLAQNKSKVCKQPSMIAFRGRMIKPRITNLSAVNKVKPAPIRESTQKLLNETYSEYQQNLGEISLEAISKVANEVVSSHGVLKKKVLATMQYATQFAGIKSIGNIVRVLNKNNIGRVGDFSGKTKADFERNNFGLNGTMHYLLERKKMADLSGINTAIFLDKNKVAQIKKDMQTNPESVHQLLADKKNKFFILSGFENGINFLTRNKNLEETTKSLITEANPDKHLIDEAEALNIKPIIIKNKNTPTLKNIYQQLQQEQMSKEELSAIIDAALIHHIPNSSMQCDAKNDVVKYLNKNLLVISPTSMAKGFEKIHEQVLDFNKSLGKTPEQILYCIPTPQKSYDLVNYQYQLVNNVDKKHFVTLDSVLEDLSSKKLKDKTIVFLDDCSMSGNSMRDNFYPFATKLAKVEEQNLNFVFAPLATTEDGVKNIQDFIPEKKNK